MKTKAFLTLFTLALMAFTLTTESQAQVKISSVKKQAVLSPQFSLKGDKPFKPTRPWLEAEVIFSAKGNTDDGYLPAALTVEFYVAVKSKKEKKTVVIKHEGTYNNVALNAKQAVAVYFPPREFARMVGKSKPSTGDVEAIAVVISYEGKPVAVESSGFKSPKSQPWKKLSPAGELLAKKDTPFRDLYYDDYLTAE